MSVCLDVGGVDHEPFEVRLFDHDFEQLLPDAFVTPPVKSAVGVVPIAKFGRQVSPRSAGTKDSDDRIDESAIILGDTTPIPLFPWEMRGDVLPTAFGTVMTV